MVFENIIPNDYLRALVIFFVLFLLLRFGFYILQRIILKLTLKTKTKLDDILMEKSSRPLTIILFLLSVNITLGELNLAENIDTIISRIVTSTMVIIIGYLVYVVFDTLIVSALKRFASRTKSKLDDNLVSLTHSVLKIALVLIIALYVLSVWGVEILPLLGALGVAGIAVALALQPTLSNIFSGASIILDHTVSKDDLIYLDQNTKGKVEKVGLRSTRIVSFDNELFIVPNSKLADSIVQNVALPEPKTRVVVPFGVAYGSNIEKVKKLILKEIDTIPNVIKEPEPAVRFLEMANSSLNFKVYFYVDSYEHRFGALDEVNTRIYNTLNKNKINIPFPQMDVHLKKE